MREILFRGKIPSGEWVEGNLIQWQNRAFVHHEPLASRNKWREVDPDTVGQFTGLLDKNGKRIFEGDIVQFHHPSPDVEDGIGVVLWHSDELAWEFRDQKAELKWYNGYAGEMYKVTGTIHDKENA